MILLVTGCCLMLKIVKFWFDVKKRDSCTTNKGFINKIENNQL